MPPLANVRHRLERLQNRHDWRSRENFSMARGPVIPTDGIDIQSYLLSERNVYRGSGLSWPSQVLELRQDNGALNDLVARNCKGSNASFCSPTGQASGTPT